MIFEIAKYSLLVMSTLILAGGLIGYKKAKSKASLIAGIISCVLLDLCFATTFALPVIGLVAGFIVLGCLDIVFLLRFFKTRLFIPAGLLLLICLAGQVVLIFGLLNFSQAFPGFP